MCTLTLLFCTIGMILNMNIISLNIRRGFVNKIDDVMNTFSNSHVIGLQETGTVDIKFIEKLNKSVEYVYYISNGEIQNEGVIIIVSKQFEDIKLNNVPRYFKGRLLHVSYKHNSCVYHVLNIYSPCRNSNEQNIFYNRLYEYCETIKKNTEKYSGVASV